MSNLRMKIILVSERAQEQSKFEIKIQFKIWIKN
jgi:hypothetical protein